MKGTVQHINRSSLLAALKFAKFPDTVSLLTVWLWLLFFVVVSRCCFTLLFHVVVVSRCCFTLLLLFCVVVVVVRCCLTLLLLFNVVVVVLRCCCCFTLLLFHVIV